MDNPYGWTGERRRSEHDITANLLEVARTGAKKTWLVYKTNINFHLLKRYLRTLLKNELVNFDGKFYTTTDRGHQYLETCNRLNSLTSR